MKKLILLSLITIGIGAAGATAQAGGLSFGITVNGPRLPFFLPPLPLILAPTAVVVGGCAQPVVVREYDRDFRYRGEVRRYGYDRRFDDRRDARYHGGGFNHR